MIFDMLEILSSLPKLATLVMFDTEYVDSERPRDHYWDQEFLQELKNRLPTLSKVRLKLKIKLKGGRTSEFILWEFNHAWSRRSVRTIEEMMENNDIMQRLNLRE